MNWQSVLDFLIAYWREIVEGLVLIISVVICLIRKRPCINEIDTIKKDILDYLPTVIRLVEKPGNGEQKKQDVIILITEFIRRRYGIILSEDLIKFVSDHIESVLSTPTKKGE